MLNTMVTHRLLQWCSLIAVFLFTEASAQDSLVTKLPDPQLSGGKPLMQVPEREKVVPRVQPPKTSCTGTFEHALGRLRR